MIESIAKGKIQYMMNQLFVCLFVCLFLSKGIYMISSSSSSSFIIMMGATVYEISHTYFLGINQKEQCTKLMSLEKISGLC
jgi:hypothetical protein